jgi:hypothetical protein
MSRLEGTTCFLIAHFVVSLMYEEFFPAVFR